jgi:hypothetical protein
LAQHLINPARTKPTSDVHFVQNFAKIPTGKTYQYQNGKKLPDEIRRIAKKFRRSPKRGDSFLIISTKTKGYGNITFIFYHFIFLVGAKLYF